MTSCSRGFGIGDNLHGIDFGRAHQGQEVKHNVALGICVLVGLVDDWSHGIHFAEDVNGSEGALPVDIDGEHSLASLDQGVGLGQIHPHNVRPSVEWKHAGDAIR